MHAGAGDRGRQLCEVAQQVRLGAADVGAHVAGLDDEASAVDPSQGVGDDLDVAVGHHSVGDAGADPNASGSAVRATASPVCCGVVGAGADMAAFRRTGRHGQRNEFP